MMKRTNVALLIMWHKVTQIKPPLIGARTEKAEALKKIKSFSWYNGRVQLPTPKKGE